MQVPIYRSLSPLPEPRSGWPIPVLDFEEIEAAGPCPADPHFPMGWPGSGPEPWVMIDVPEGSRLENCPIEDDQGVIESIDQLMLVLPDGQVLDADEALRRFGDPALVRDLNEALKLSLDSTHDNPESN